jgi:flagellar motility protein MotE (MotC chaperone)
VADLKKYPDAVWDRFFDFAFAECASAPRAEIQQTLKKLGIDLTKAMSKVQQAIQTAKAREELASAKAKRPGLLKTLASLASPVGIGLRDKLRGVINTRFGGSVQAAYFRKLEEAASEADLQSLLEDMARLEALEQEEGDGTATNQ